MTSAATPATRNDASCRSARTKLSDMASGRCGSSAWVSASFRSALLALLVGVAATCTGRLRSIKMVACRRRRYTTSCWRPHDHDCSHAQCGRCSAASAHAGRAEASHDEADVGRVGRSVQPRRLAGRTLGALLEQEVNERETRRLARARDESQLPPDKSLASFDFDAVPAVSKAQSRLLPKPMDGLLEGTTCLSSGRRA